MRLAQPVLRRMLRMWLAAVCSLMKSRAPISRLLSPCARARRANIPADAVVEVGPAALELSGRLRDWAAERADASA